MVLSHRFAKLLRRLQSESDPVKVPDVSCNMYPKSEDQSKAEIEKWEQIAYARSCLHRNCSSIMYAPHSEFSTQLRFPVYSHTVMSQARFLRHSYVKSPHRSLSLRCSQQSCSPSCLVSRIPPLPLHCHLRYPRSSDGKSPESSSPPSRPALWLG